MAGRRAVLAAAAAVVTGRVAAQQGLGIGLLVGAPRGTAGDRWARGFAPFLERHWPGSSVTVVNQPGEGGLAAARVLAEAAPDGRAIGLVATPALMARAIERGLLPLLDRIDFVACVADEPVVLVGPPGTEVAALKGQGAGGLLGCPPPGSAAQLAAAALGGTLPLTPLPFPSAPAARQALLAGHLAAALLPLGDAIVALREDRLAALALGMARRSELLPDTPVFAELGLAAAPKTQRGCAVPRGVPPPVLSALTEALRNAVADPEFADQATAQGFLPHFSAGADWAGELAALREGLLTRWAREPWVARRG